MSQVVHPCVICPRCSKSGPDPALAIPHSFRVGMHPGCLIGVQKQAKLCRGMIAMASCLLAAVPEFADWTDAITRDSMNQRRGNCQRRFGNLVVRLNVGLELCGDASVFVTQTATSSTTHSSSTIANTLNTILLHHQFGRAAARCSRIPYSTPQWQS